MGSSLRAKRSNPTFGDALDPKKDDLSTMDCFASLAMTGFYERVAARVQILSLNEPANGSHKMVSENQNMCYGEVLWLDTAVGSHGHSD
jgi:hypothetical protein